MSTQSQKIVFHLNEKYGSKNFEEFVKVLIKKQLMNEEDFKNLARAFKVKKKKAPLNSFRNFMKQAKKSKGGSSKNSGMMETADEVLIAKPNAGNVQMMNSEGSSMMNFGLQGENGGFGGFNGAPNTKQNGDQMAQKSDGNESNGVMTL